jgi:tRNA(Ile2) C34 agmatinyltransferase TiaS
MKDQIIGVRSEVRVDTYVLVRCGCCGNEFETAAMFRTARCKRCGRVCELDVADRTPEALPDGVVPLRHRA